MAETATLSPHEQSLRLTIRIGTEAVIFAIGSPNGKHRIVNESFPLNRSISIAANLRELATRSELMGSGYRRAQVMVQTEPMVVPIDEYSNEDMPTLYHCAFSGHRHEELITNVMPDLHAVVVFPVNKDLKSVLSELFADLTFIPIVQPVWQLLYRRNFATPRKKLFAYFHDRRMDVFCYTQNRLRFCNNFDGTREQDALYYLLYAWRQLGFHGEDDELLLVGDVPKREWLAEKLHTYVRRFSIINPAALFGASSASLDHKLPFDLKTIFLGKR